MSLQEIKRKAIALGASDAGISKVKNKKYYVIYNKKRINFGYKPMQDYTQHHGEKRRKSYLARAKGIKNKAGKLTYKDKSSPNFWSINLLW